MASIYHDILYPPKNRVLFDGGLNTKFDNTTIQDNESPSCLNVIFSAGACETRLGSAKLNTAAVSTHACDGLYTKNNTSGSQTMTAWYNGTLHELSGTSFHAVTLSTGIFTAGIRVGSAEYENYRFYGNGGVIPIKYKDGAYTRHGVYPPLSGVTVASTAGSYVSGDFVWGVSYVNTNLVESNLSPLCATFTAAGTGVLLTSVPVAPASYGVESRNIYRNIHSSTLKYFVGSIANNTATTFVDNIPDTQLIVAAPTDNGVPPMYQVVLTHMGRLFVIDPSDNLVKFSEAANPYVFKALSFIRVGDKAGDLPRTLALSDNNLVVQCDDSTHIVIMQDNEPANWGLLRLKIPYGSKSPWGYFTFNDRLFFCAVRDNKLVGFAYLLGASVDPAATNLETMSVTSDMLTDKIEPDIKLISQSAQFKNISAISFNNRAFITVPTGSTTTYNNQILYFDFRPENLSSGQKFAFAPWSGLNITQFCTYGGKLYGASSNAVGFVYELEKESTYSDSGVAINSYYQTKEIGGFNAHDIWTKDFRWLHILLETAGTYFMNMYTKTDSYIGDGSLSTVYLDPGSSVYGTAVYGIDNYDPGKRIAEYKIPVGGYKGKRIQFKFTNQNTANQKFKLVGMTLSYNLRGKR